MANTGLLVLTKPSKVRKLLPLVSERVAKTLYVHYFPARRSDGGLSLGEDATSKRYAPRYARAVANIYAFASTLGKLDVRVLLGGIKGTSSSTNGAALINTKRPIELVIFDEEYERGEARTFIEDCLANTSMGCEYVVAADESVETSSTLSSTEEKTTEEETTVEETKENGIYRNVVLGGTFDRLHEGHKILLSEALLRCSEKLTVGVTDGDMIKGKVLWELIEPCAKRIKALRDFLEDVDPATSHEIVPIIDIYGPTRTDPYLEMLVVSVETSRGGEKVNELRISKGLKPLDVKIVALARDELRAEHEDTKISSSNRRMRLLGTRLKLPRTKIFDVRKKRPYVIGLTGGIASGKSSVARKLQSLGASLVNCDLIAHDLYQPGERCYESIVENYGTKILRPDGTIDRRALGQIVFGDSREREKLNNFVWPAILETAKRRIAEFREKDARIVVMEAAVLIQAKWQNECEEIWTCILPPEEAVARVVERNSVTIDEAKLRIDAQPSNVEQVEAATVVFSTLWSHDVTMRQVAKAWEELEEFLNYSSER